MTQGKKWDYNYFPDLSQADLSLEQRFLLQKYVGDFKKLTKEQLYGLALDSLVLLMTTRNVAKNIIRTEINKDFEKIDEKHKLF